MKAELQQKKDLLLQKKGLFQTFSSFYTDLEQLNKDLVLLKSMPNAPLEEIHSKEYEIKAIEKILLKASAINDDVD